MGASLGAVVLFIPHITIRSTLKALRLSDEPFFGGIIDPAPQGVVWTGRVS